MLNPADKIARRLNSSGKQINEAPWCPKPFLNGCEWACADAMVTHPPLLDNMKMEAVKVKDLEHTQMFYDRDTVNDYADRKVFDGILCFKRQGQNYIYDGRHRALAAEQAGEDEINAYVIDMRDSTPHTIHQFARILGVPAKDILQYMSIDDRRAYGDDGN